MDGLLQIRDLGLQKEPTRPIKFQTFARRDLKPRPRHHRQNPPPAEPAGQRRRKEGRGGEAADTYRVLEVDSALDDLPAAPGHDGDLHPAAPGGGEALQ
jgi:hypothetical protein